MEVVRRHPSAGRSKSCSRVLITIKEHTNEVAPENPKSATVALGEARPVQLSYWGTLTSCPSSARNHLVEKSGQSLGAAGALTPGTCAGN